MKTKSTAPKCVFSLFVCFVVLLACAIPALAQTGTTGALTGTVTDPSGAVITGATVTATNVGTGQERTATTGSDGAYKISLLRPGNYRVRFTASGFKTVEVPSITVSVTETALLNHSLEIGAQSQQVTVESTAVTVQTENATVGGLVSGKTITDLPLSTRNYTQIINLSPGVVVNVASAAAVGNGTQDINVNGSGSDQNNYMMDGASLTNYGSGGGAQSGNFPGIGIPNPDAIQEFKIQTSQYDAVYGRNPGASVNVVTRGGTNNFHGAAWEFFRNRYFNANDSFNKISEAALQQPNKPLPLNQNEFGGSFGGPIKRDKLFFFGSYQGLRQINGLGTNGFASGSTSNLTLLPLDLPGGGRKDTAGTINQRYDTSPSAIPCNYATYREYVGCVFAGYKGPGTGVAILPDGSNINQVAINILQRPGPQTGVNKGFYVPSMPFANGEPLKNCLTAPSTCAVTIVAPFHANEDQYLANFDYVISSKHTLSERYFYSRDPQRQEFICQAPCDPGSPEVVRYTSQSALVKLTSVLSSSFVNESRVSFQRGTTVAAPGNYIASCDVGIVPSVDNGVCGAVTNANPILLQVPVITISVAGAAGVPGAGSWAFGGNFFSSATNFFNTFQYADQISWNHGKHAIRSGVEIERVQYNWTLPARMSLSFANFADFLTSASGLPGTNCGVTGTPACTDPPTVVTGGLSAPPGGFGQPNGNVHYQRANDFSAFVQDDIKLTKNLTLNLGLRWEYDGYPAEIQGLFTNIWTTQAGLVNTGSFFFGNQVTNPNPTIDLVNYPPNKVGTLAGFVVGSNYNPNIARCGNAAALSACGLVAPPGVFAGYPGGATGVYFNTNKTMVHGAPIDDFAPRIGLAWQPLGSKLVVRAGYGIFYDRVYANLLANQLNALPPYNGSVPFVPSASLDLPSPLSGLIGWNPRTLRVNAGSAATGATSITGTNGGLGIPGLSADSEFLGVPIVQQYNLDLQYEFAKNWVADIGYVGTHGTHLYDWNRPLNIAHLVAGGPSGTPAPNLPDPTTDPQNAAMVVPYSALPVNDVANTNPATQVVMNTLTNVPGRVGYLGYATGSIVTTDTTGDHRYNSLQAQLRHQFSHGLTLQASYTWSKLITNINYYQSGGGIAAPGNVLSGGAGSNNPLDLRQQYGLAAFNRPQRLVISYSYDLPYKKTEGLAGRAFGGWTVSGVTTIQTGEPFTVIYNGPPGPNGGGRVYYGSTGLPFGRTSIRAELAPANAGACNSLGICQGTGLTTSGSTLCRLGQPQLYTGCSTQQGWINTSAFVAPPCIGGTVQDQCASSGGATGFGNSGVGSIMGPGQHNWDMSIIKNTKLTETTNIQFRAEFYNMWNHPQYNPPGADRFFLGSTFGKITSASVPPRVVQFALKFSF